MFRPNERSSSKLLHITFAWIAIKRCTTCYVINNVQSLISATCFIHSNLTNDFLKCPSDVVTAQPCNASHNLRVELDVIHDAMCCCAVSLG